MEYNNKSGTCTQSEQLPKNNGVSVGNQIHSKKSKIYVTPAGSASYAGTEIRPGAVPEESKYCDDNCDDWHADALEFLMKHPIKVVIKDELKIAKVSEIIQHPHHKYITRILNMELRKEQIEKRGPGVIAVNNSMEVMYGWQDLKTVTEMGWDEVYVMILNMSEKEEKRLIYAELIDFDYMMIPPSLKTLPFAQVEQQRVKVSSLHVHYVIQCLRSENSKERLKDRIQEFGLIEPISVNKKMEVLNGWKRLQALKELGIEEVEVLVLEREPRFEQILISNEFHKWQSIYYYLFPGAGAISGRLASLGAWMQCSV